MAVKAEGGRRQKGWGDGGRIVEHRMEETEGEVRGVGQRCSRGAGGEECIAGMGAQTTAYL